MLEELLALIAPPACAVCGGGCGVGRRLCERCEPALRNSAPVWSSVPGIDFTWSAAAYDGVARQLVAALKFRARLGLARDAAALIAGRAPADLLAGSVVPVPAPPLAAAAAGSTPRKRSRPPSRGGAACLSPHASPARRARGRWDDEGRSDSRTHRESSRCPPRPTGSCWWTTS